MTWREEAACRHVPTEVFFPTQPGMHLEALDVCAVCPVVAPCRQEGIGQFGIWGGRLRNVRVS